MNPVYIDIGEFIKPHGIFGELLFNLHNPLSNVMDSECEFFIKENGAYKKLEIEKIRRANKGYLIKLNGVDSIESAEKFKRTFVYINKTDIKLDKDEFLISDLIGLNSNGEATSIYIQKILSPYNVRISVLARGIPIGSDLEYVDKDTLSEALNYRKKFD